MATVVIVDEKREDIQEMKRTRRLLNCYIVTLLITCVLLVRPVLAAGVEYNLPYPGLLPDSPLYILKLARDKVVEVFIFDQKQKAFYYILQSDKRVAAGEMLAKKKNLTLSATTILIGQQYFTRAADLVVKINDPDLTAKAVAAGAKHKEVITVLEQIYGQDKTGNLGKALTAAQKDENRVLELMSLK